ncbi:MAG: thermonuclease family protein [Candidatus Desulfofervidaceae bacterium]|nr:thermonuclease family protein [Candidatus Desulfofervidaceae bacterium]MDL1970839.1 thermonuclease family protein [Candidatus Desulfofervidaceae bacterium]
MLKRFCWIIVVFCVLFFACSTHSHYVRWVDDGDTIVLDNGQKVRYLGINAPEIAQDDKPGEPFGKEALKYNLHLVKGKEVRLETDVEKYDRYGRLLAYVFLKDGTFVNLEMVKAGYAYVLFLNPYLHYAHKLLAAQHEAMEARKNIWQVLLEDTCAYYLGNKKSHKFHRPDCKYGKKIFPSNLVIFKTKWDAFFQGFSPCRSCKP